LLHNYEPVIACPHADFAMRTRDATAMSERTLDGWGVLSEAGDTGGGVRLSGAIRFNRCAIGAANDS
jgi:hypothetical protein